jgi:hypothetical protein
MNPGMPVLGPHLALLRALILSRRQIALANVALRHLLNALRRSVKRPALTAGDKAIWPVLRRVFPGWEDSRRGRILNSHNLGAALGATLTRIDDHSRASNMGGTAPWRYTIAPFLADEFLGTTGSASHVFLARRAVHRSPTLHIHRRVIPI